MGAFISMEFYIENKSKPNGINGLPGSTFNGSFVIVRRQPFTPSMDRANRKWEEKTPNITKMFQDILRVGKYEW